MGLAADLFEKTSYGASRATILAAVLASFIVYIVTLAIYRLHFSPIAKFPGPKLAALSKWYEFYYEIVQKGKFSDHITDLHKVYGMIGSSVSNPRPAC